MTYPYGNNFKIYINGGSHDEKMELIVEGFPRGVRLENEALDSLLRRRAARCDGISTSRREADEPVFVSGIKDGMTTGETVKAYVYNRDTDPAAYDGVNDVPRPSHADYAAVKKYGSDVDLRGGGHFSGRLTVMLCVAGALCESLLHSRGIEVFAKIASIAGIDDTPINPVNPVGARMIKQKDFAVFDDGAGEKMKAAILSAAAEGDSVGGVTECAVIGLPAGLGEHFFAGVEARISSAVLAVPGVKGVEFGSGFGGSELKGSQNNDAFFTDGERVFTHSNNSGGILGGMTNGMPVVFRAAFKPTPSIAKKQHSVSLSKLENVEISINGRHDPCIVPRGTAAVEAAAAIAVCDLLLDGGEEKTLENCRKKINAVDTSLVSLINRRMEVCREIGEIKINNSLAVKDEARETELLDRVSAAADEGLAPLVRGIYEQILSLSRELQYKKKIYLIGERLEHSYSVPIHAEFGDYDYSLKEIRPNALGEFLKNGEFGGLNVTIPYKKAVIPYLDGLDDYARETRAVNTIIKTENGLYGCNTDCIGFEKLLINNEIYPAGKKVVVLGNGGAAASVKAVMERFGAAEVVMISRNGENRFCDISRHYDAVIIVNATPVGMYPDNGYSLVQLDNFKKCECVIDLIYNPQTTALLCDAERLGIRSVNGLSMLVYQAAEARRLFCGRLTDARESERIIDLIARKSRNIVLIGMPGSGKSTVGSILAKKLGRYFFDTDIKVEDYGGMTPEEIITEYGEEAFRKKETKACESLGKRSGIVIATGGGVVTRSENYLPLHQNSVIVWLKRNIDELAVDSRPVTAGRGIEQLFAERAPLYESFCDVQCEACGSEEETADAIIKALEGLII